MRWPWIACLLLASLLPVSAEDWTTEDGHTYHNVTVVGQEDDGVRITYDGGVGKIPYYELPVDIQKRFGQDVDSLAAKKQAVDKAVNDALRAAADTQVVPPVATPEQPGVPQNTPPSSVAPNGNAANGAPSTAPGTSAPPGVAPNGAPANSSATTGPAGTPNKPRPAATPTPGATANTAPGAPAHPGAHPAGGGAESVELPSLAEPVSRTPQPVGVNGAGGKPLELSVANYTYNEQLDVCYLDSPPIDIYPGPLSKPPTPSAQGSSLTLRIVTDGRTPQAPDRYEATLLCVGGDNSDLGAAPIAFNAETGTITLADSNRKDSGSLPGSQSMRYASFYLSAAQVEQICNGKPLTFTIGPDIYHIDEHGAETLRNYLSDVETLQPATSSLIHSFYKLLARIPSFFSILSTICEYVILGSFGLLVAASIAAFILGISRFIKM